MQFAHKPSMTVFRPQSSKLLNNSGTQGYHLTWSPGRDVTAIKGTIRTFLKVFAPVLSLALQHALVALAIQFLVRMSLENILFKENLFYDHIIPE
jgi:hypothetical protein